MRIHLDEVIIHNFLSIGDATLQLANQGYVLVEGHNNNPADGALSNGSGKSSLWNAICWVLTGETIQGLKSNIPNIHGEDGCFVTLKLKVDNNDYEITRYREYAKIKNDLKIKINGEDKSGKGLRESEELLSQYLPELTSDLIGNVIILGQGLPHKFSNNTPAGRKELLETLSRSDFMIEDIKGRISTRSTDLADKLRRQEDEQLKATTEQSLLEKQQITADQQLADLNKIDVNLIECMLKQYEAEEAKYQAQLDTQNETRNKLQAESDAKNEEYHAATLEAANIKTKLLEEYNAKLTPVKEELIKTQAEMRSLEAEITKLESITDVCPTCGQKLPNVEKPSTAKQKASLAELESRANQLTEKSKELEEAHKRDLTAAQSDMNAKVKELQTQVQSYSNQLWSLKDDIAQTQQKITSLQVNAAHDKAQLESLEASKQNLTQTLESLKAQISELAAKILYNKEDIEKTEEHIDALNKINSLVKRDFRGILLTNVIEFIDAKIKLYSSYVFNTQDVRLYLDGNNVNIEYCGKAYEGLSGGEKQRMDIIIQLAIRDMMCQYLDFSANILVVDECFDGLDAVGCEKILDLISACVTDVESLFIISHHSESLQIPADNILVIEKDERGISRLVK